MRAPSPQAATGMCTGLEGGVHSRAESTPRQEGAGPLVRTGPGEVCRDQEPSRATAITRERPPRSGSWCDPVQADTRPAQAPGAQETEAVHRPVSARCQQVQNTVPSGLGFVRDLLTTGSLDKPVPPALLKAADAAEEWLASSLTTLHAIDSSAPPPPHPLGTRSLARLSTLRDSLRSRLSAGHTDEPP